MLNLLINLNVAVELTFPAYNGTESHGKEMDELKFQQAKTRTFINKYKVQPEKGGLKCRGPAEGSKCITIIYDKSYFGGQSLLKLQQRMPLIHPGTDRARKPQVSSTGVIPVKFIMWTDPRL